MAFTNIIPEALSMSLYAASTTDYTRQLKFYLKWMPEEFQPSDIAGSYLLVNILATDPVFPHPHRGSARG